MQGDMTQPEHLQDREAEWSNDPNARVGWPQFTAGGLCIGLSGPQKPTHGLKQRLTRWVGVLLPSWCPSQEPKRGQLFSPWSLRNWLLLLKMGWTEP